MALLQTYLSLEKRRSGFEAGWSVIPWPAEPENLSPFIIDREEQREHFKTAAEALLNWRKHALSYTFGEALEKRPSEVVDIIRGGLEWLAKNHKKTLSGTLSARARARGETVAPDELLGAATKYLEPVLQHAEWLDRRLRSGFNRTEAALAKRYHETLRWRLGPIVGAPGEPVDLKALDGYGVEPVSLASTLTGNVLGDDFASATTRLWELSSELTPKVLDGEEAPDGRIAKQWHEATGMLRGCLAQWVGGSAAHGVIAQGDPPKERESGSSTGKEGVQSEGGRSGSSAPERRAWTQQELDNAIRDYKSKRSARYAELCDAMKTHEPGARKAARKMFGRNAVALALGVRSRSMVSKSPAWVAIARELEIPLNRERIKGTRRTRPKGKIGLEVALEQEGLTKVEEADPGAELLRNEQEETLREIRRLPKEQAEAVLAKYQERTMTDEEVRETVRTLLDEG